MVPVMERLPEMVRRTPLDRLAGDVRPVLDVDDARTYWEICDAVYPVLGIPAGTFSVVFDPEQLLDPDRVWACLAYQDGRPVACASSWFAAGVGCLGWIASLPDVRGRGLAAACTVAAANQTLELGADVVSLQASEMGEDLYRRLGFEEIFAYRVLGATPDLGE
jgi:GNAT superfamily N-acetyltransferase